MLATVSSVKAHGDAGSSCQKRTQIEFKNTKDMLKSSLKSCFCVNKKKKNQETDILIRADNICAPWRSESAQLAQQ